jgi:glycosyltransferase involved in cell wall biosynthesis
MRRPCPPADVVVNDGSSDNTEAILRELEGVLPPSFTWVTQPHGHGLARARNLGIGHPSGGYVALLDHDDTWYRTSFRASSARSRLRSCSTAFSRVAEDFVRPVVLDD